MQGARQSPHGTRLDAKPSVEWHILNPANSFVLSCPGYSKSPLCRGTLGWINEWKTFAGALGHLHSKHPTWYRKAESLG